ncbi:MAG TPA: tetratricopeptide repeat protein [Bacteroidetes bacterium]|nr:tetratricopeptide repeat protein [Bacteroidota bacterium]
MKFGRIEKDPQIQSEMKNRLLHLFTQKPYWGWAVLIFLLAFLQYANTLGHDYAWDDAIVIVENERVQKGVSGIIEHFQFRERGQFSDFSGFRPVVMASFAIDQSISPLNPAVGHLVNVLLFALLCVTLFYTLLQLFPQTNPIFTFLVSLLFLVHPLHVEVVANIKSRDEILALLFGLLALQTFVRHYQQGKGVWLLLSTFCLLLALWSKETGYFMIPVLGLAVLVVLPGNLKRKGIALAKLAGQGLILVGLIWMVTGNAPGAVTQVSGNVFQENLVMGNSLAIPNSERNLVGQEAHLFYLYLKSFVFPHPLVYYSGFAQIPVWEMSSLAMLLSLGLLLLAIGGGVWALMRQWKEATFGLWFFLLTLAFFLQPFGLYLADAKADRFMFMPSLGLCLLVLAVLFRILKLDNKHGLEEWLAQGKLKLYGVTGIFFVVILLFSAKTFFRNEVWKDNFTLFSADMPQLENCAKAHYYYANALRAKVGENPDAQVQAEILGHYRRAVEITPLAYFSYLELGKYLNGMGNFAAAETAMLEAVTSHPKQPEVCFLLGRAQFALGKYEAAVQHLERAMRLDQGPDETWEFLGRALAGTGNFAEANRILQQALQRNSGNIYLWDALSDAFYDGGQIEESFPPLFEILKIDGNNPIWWKKLIGRYQLIGDAEMASQYYLQARERGILP